MKDSFILYNSFYEPIKSLKNEQLGKLFRAVFNYTINGEIAQDSEILVPFMFIKNQIDLDSKKWIEEKQKRSEAGKKGMKNRWHNNDNSVITKDNSVINVITDYNKLYQGITNITDNVNVNDNVNDNDIYNNSSSSSYNNNIYDFVEKNFGRILTPIEINKIDDWKNSIDENIIKHAIKIAVLKNKNTFSYVDGILKNWKTTGFKTLKDIKENEIKKEDNQEIFDYDWLNEEDNDEI